MCLILMCLIFEAKKPTSASRVGFLLCVWVDISAIYQHWGKKDKNIKKNQIT